MKKKIFPTLKILSWMCGTFGSALKAEKLEKPVDGENVKKINFKKKELI